MRLSMQAGGCSRRAARRPQRRARAQRARSGGGAVALRASAAAPARAREPTDPALPHSVLDTLFEFPGAHAATHDVACEDHGGAMHTFTGPATPCHARRACIPPCCRAFKCLLLVQQHKTSSGVLHDALRQGTASRRGMPADLFAACLGRARVQGTRAPAAGLQPTASVAGQIRADVASRAGGTEGCDKGALARTMRRVGGVPIRSGRGGVCALPPPPPCSAKNMSSTRVK